MDELVNQLTNYVTKAIPDTQSSIRKYLDAKFEYLSFCLKMKELEDEEAAVNEARDYLPRLESGNYEYRVMLRCRETSREHFIQMRKHVMIKTELLDEKHVRELALQLRSLVQTMQSNHTNCRDLLRRSLEDKLSPDSDPQTLLTKEPVLGALIETALEEPDTKEIEEINLISP